MKERQRLGGVRAFIAVVVCMLAACGGGDDEGTGTSAHAVLGAPCNEDADCLEGSCEALTSEWSACTRACDTDADCDPAEGEDVRDVACGVTATRERRCIRACPTQGSTACVDGVTTVCEVAGDAHCDTCGCPDDLRCEPGVGCQSLSDVGGPCRSNADCRSRNCSADAYLCRVPIGQPCTADDCDVCFDMGEASYCSRECGDSNECNGGVCIDRTVSGACTDEAGCSVCYPRCEGRGDASCGGTCRVFAGIPGGSDGGYYCDCDCADVVARPIGARCLDNSQCTSNRCWNGYCTDRCAGDDECGAHGRCVDTPCGEGSNPEDCGALCLPECEWGCQHYTCPERERLEGGSVAVCDKRGDASAACDTDRECLSGHCAGGTCASPSGAGNGEPCDGDGDCAAGTCISARCRGAAVIGEPCEVDADCAVGRCGDGECS